MMFFASVTVGIMTIFPCLSSISSQALHLQKRGDGTGMRNHYHVAHPKDADQVEVQLLDDISEPKYPSDWTLVLGISPEGKIFAHNVWLSQDPVTLQNVEQATRSILQRAKEVVDEDGRYFVITGFRQWMDNSEPGSDFEGEESSDAGDEMALEVGQAVDELAQVTEGANVAEEVVEVLDHVL